MECSKEKKCIYFIKENTTVERENDVTRVKIYKKLEDRLGRMYTKNEKNVPYLRGTLEERKKK